MRPAQEALHRLVDQIFEDGIVTAAERSELVSLYRGAGLTVSEVKEVFTAFVQKTWGEAKADGVVTPAEIEKLETIVRELHVPEECVPESVARFALRARVMVT